MAWHFDWEINRLKHFWIFDAILTFLVPIEIIVETIAATIELEKYISGQQLCLELKRYVLETG